MIKNESEIKDLKVTLTEVQDLIKEEEWIKSGRRVYIVRNDKTIRGKVYDQRFEKKHKWRWFHIGQTKALEGKSDDDLKKIVIDKFYTSLITKRD